MYNQITDTIFMVKPVHFKRNEQTAVNNYFQKTVPDEGLEEIQHHALDEFDLLVEKLRQHDIEVIVFTDTESSETPDSIFPNNWITLHDDGTILLYPMFAPNRRKERRQDIIERLRKDFFVGKIHSYSDWEQKDKFLEGTGSLILDRPNKVAYAALSDRTSEEVLADFSKTTGYQVVSFHALQTVGSERLPIYHTNVMMSVGENFAVVCLDSIDDPVERERLVFSMEKTGKEIIVITENQLVGFTGNIIQLRNKKGNSIIVMSTVAYEKFTHDQIRALREHGDILHSPIPTIETLGGGGVRCMIAEIFLPKYTLQI